MRKMTLFERALLLAGYEHEQPTMENVRNCLLDYVDAGVFSNMTREDVEDLTPEEMALGLRVEFYSNKGEGKSV